MKRQQKQEIKNVPDLKKIRTYEDLSLNLQLLPECFPVEFYFGVSATILKELVSVTSSDLCTPTALTSQPANEGRPDLSLFVGNSERLHLIPVVEPLEKI